MRPNSWQCPSLLTHWCSVCYVSDFIVAFATVSTVITMRRQGTSKQNRFEDRLGGASQRLGSAGDRVVGFVRENREIVLASSAAELGARIGTSDATVVRTIQSLGFAGLPELKDAILDSLAAASTP